jgi:hypothetical protein
MMQSHLLHMLTFSALVSVFFAFLTRDEARDRWRFGLVMGLSMILLSLALAWAMYPFPR